MSKKPKLLIVSYSDISADARVLRQVHLFENLYEVVTCGYGPVPAAGVVEHIQIPPALTYWKRNRLLTILRMYRAAYWSSPANRWCRDTLRGRQFDMILANDVETQGLAATLNPRLGFHADLHEYSPSQHEELRRWKMFVAPFVRWQLRKYTTQAASSTAVAPIIARRFSQEFNLETQVVVSASPYHALQPTPVSSSTPIRLVHAGAANPNRQLEILIAAVLPLAGHFTLDLYLTATNPAYIGKLQQLLSTSEDSGHIRILPAVPYQELIPTLNQYDMAFYSFPPVTYNLEHCLPNKFFDSVQARLGIVTGPNPEIAQYVRKYQLGRVSEDYSATALRAALQSVTPDEVRKWKANSHAAAFELSAQEQSSTWLNAIAELAARD